MDYFHVTPEEHDINLDIHFNFIYQDIDSHNHA